MSTGEGPSARNTCAMRCSARIQASGAQSTPYQGAPIIPAQDTTAQSVPSISAQDTSTVSALSSVPTQIFTSREAPVAREGRSSARAQNPIRAPHSRSVPTPIARTQEAMQDQPEESTPREEPIERATDSPYNPEQEFMTAPVSINPPMEGMSRESPISKGKGRARDVTPQSERDPSSGNDEAESPHNLHHEIDWPLLVQMITHWSTQSDQSREEVAS